MEKRTNEIETISVAPSYEAVTKRPPAEDSLAGLKFSRLFTEEGVHPFDQVEWTFRSSSIYDEKGEVIFHLDQVEIPDDWSQLAVDIAASKYFRKAGVPEIDYESSIRQLVHRVAHTIRTAGEDFGGYFESAGDAGPFDGGTAYMLVTQRSAFK